MQMEHPVSYQSCMLDKIEFDFIFGKKVRMVRMEQLDHPEHPAVVVHHLPHLQVVAEVVEEEDDLFVFTPWNTTGNQWAHLHPMRTILLVKMLIFYLLVIWSYYRRLSTGTMDRLFERGERAIVDIFRQHSGLDPFYQAGHYIGNKLRFFQYYFPLTGPAGMKI